MPRNILYFERLMYGTIVIGLIVLALDYSRITGATEPFGPGFALAVGLIALIFMVLLIWLAARRRKNWARWLILIVFMVDGPLSLLHLGQVLQLSLLTGAAQILQFMMQVAALYFCFTGDAKLWFRKPAAINADTGSQ